MSVVQSGRYDWSAVGVSGPIADVPAALDIEVIPDSAPRIEILAPTVDTTVSPADTIDLSFLATDDHGIANVVLRVWRHPEGGSAMPETSRPLVSQATTQWTGEASLSLPAIGAQPGEAVHVVATAIDGSPWRQNGSSRELVLKLPGLSEARANIRAAADSALQKARAAAAAQKSLAQRTNDAAKARQRPNPQQQKNAANKENSMSYESAQQAQQLAKEQRDIAERMQQLQKTAEQLEKQLKQTGALDSALSARLQEAQKLLRDALTPELAEKLRKLEESAQKLSQEEAQKALGDLAQQQNKLREQLEKSVEMLKRAALVGSMQTMKEEAKEIS
jgi:flagellar biosynthesis GTPase FlhF